MPFGRNPINGAVQSKINFKVEGHFFQISKGYAYKKYTKSYLVHKSQMNGTCDLSIKAYFLSQNF